MKNLVTYQNRDIKTIDKYINNLLKEQKLEKTSSVAKFTTLQHEGGEKVIRDIDSFEIIGRLK